jgi:hypothetical protein
LVCVGSKLEEYKDLKQQVAAQTSQHKAKLMALQRQQQTDKVGITHREGGWCDVSL